MKRYFILALLCCVLMSCETSTPPDNVVATVNGKPITLLMLQSMQDLDFVDFDDSELTSLEKFRNQYGSTLSTIIFYEIILQFVENTKYAITNAHVEAYENNLRSDYPEGEFEKYVTENAINLNAWRNLLRYQLALDAFKKFFLDKGYVPSTQQVKDYYEENKSNFVLPDSLTLQIALSEDKKSLENINNIQGLLAIGSEISQYSTMLSEQTLQKEWKNDVLALKEGNCTKIFKQEDVFTILCLEKKNDKKLIAISDAYLYIETQLKDIYFEDTLYEWLEKNLQNTDVKVSEHLLEEIL